MTALLTPAPSTEDLRSPCGLLQRQLAGIEAWHAHRRSQSALPTGASREDRLDAARRNDVLLRVQDALLATTAATLRSADTPCAVIGRRAVVAHRNEWFRTKVCHGLEASGIEVLASLGNGADALGTAVAEQPDLLLLEDSLPMMSAAEVLSHCEAMLPLTRVVVHVAYEDAGPALLDAGAAATYSRRVPPVDVVDGALLLLV